MVHKDIVGLINSLNKIEKWTGIVDFLISYKKESIQNESNWTENLIQIHLIYWKLIFNAKVGSSFMTKVEAEIVDT